jgi:hypothetical protein
VLRPDSRKRHSTLHADQRRATMSRCASPSNLPTILPGFGEQVTYHIITCDGCGHVDRVAQHPATIGAYGTMPSYAKRRACSDPRCPRAKALYEELGSGLRKFSALAAAGLVMNVRTGEILAMVSVPSFDPYGADAASSFAHSRHRSQGCNNRHGS